MSRRIARQYGFELIFQIPYHEEFDTERAFELYSDNFIMLNSEEKKFVHDIFSGTYQNIEEIDLYIEKHSKKWATNRLNREVLAVFRLAIYEMLFMEEIPNAISVNEAVEISKIYCDESTLSYINGVLINISNDIAENGPKKTDKSKESLESLLDANSINLLGEEIEIIFDDFIEEGIENEKESL